jgi:phosphoglycolate phosphatase
MDLGSTLRDFCKYLGISKETFYKWTDENGEDAKVDFIDSIKNGKEAYRAALIAKAEKSLLELVEGAKSEENIMRMRGEFIPYYDAHNADFSTPYAGITELLTCLQQQGIALAVASNKYQAATQKLVAHYFPNIRFVKISGQKPEIPIKPDPAIVFDIIGETKFAKDEVLYVGDSGVDMQTALNAGIDAVGVSWGFRTKQELASYSPVGIIDNAEDLLKFIE